VFCLLVLMHARFDACFNIRLFRWFIYLFTGNLCTDDLKLCLCQLNNLKHDDWSWSIAKAYVYTWTNKHRCQQSSPSRTVSPAQWRFCTSCQPRLRITVSAREAPWICRVYTQRLLTIQSTRQLTVHLCNTPAGHLDLTDMFKPLYVDVILSYRSFDCP